MSEIFSGNTITIENLGNSKAKLNKIGNSWQATRSGKNELDTLLLKVERTVNGVTFTPVFDNNGDLLYVNVNGTATAITTVAIASFIPILNTEYKVNGCPTGGTISTAYVYMTGDVSNVNGQDTSAIWKTEGSKSYQIIVREGATITNMKFYPMVRLATVTDSTYEQYGAMPSPEFPSPIKNVTGSAKITVCNKNLLKSLKWNNGTYIYAKLPKLNTRYFLSLRLKEGKTIPNDLYFGFSSDGDYNNSGFTKWLIEKGVFSSYNSVDKDNFKYTSNIRYDGTLLGYIAVFPTTYAGVLGEYFDIQLEEETNSDYPTDYVESKSQTFLFPLSEGQKLYKDSYLADDGVHHPWGEKIFDGTETIYDYGNNLAYYIQPFAPEGYTNSTIFNESSGIGMCSHLTWIRNAADINNGIRFQHAVGTRLYILKENTSVENLKAWFAEQYTKGTPVKIQYKLANEVIEPYTSEQENVYMQLQNMELYEGINHIFIEDEPYAEISVTVTKLIEDYEAYISATGRLIIPSLNINYLVDLNESNIPTMPEAVESAVRAAGRDGDIVLNTTYEPIPFNIVCYTEDNLTLIEKVEEEKKVNKLLNSIKNGIMTFALEKANKFYNVKYSGALTTMNYPKHLKFSIPLKSSESYGKDLIKKSIVGNSVGESQTAEKVGALFILRGPATNPMIALNDYSMEYNMSILEGARVEINSSKSTITNINASGVKTNVMKYYNHQFPKIENGVNELKVLSGFDSDMQVSVIWNDLKL